MIFFHSIKIIKSNKSSRGALERKNDRQSVFRSIENNLFNLVSTNNHREIIIFIYRKIYDENFQLNYISICVRIR